MATSGVDQAKGEDLLLGEWSEGKHIHGVVQRTLQRRERKAVLRCEEHMGVEKSDC